MNRRSFLLSTATLAAALVAAPAVVRAESLMRIVRPTTLLVPWDSRSVLWRPDKAAWQVSYEKGNYVWSALSYSDVPPEIYDRCAVVAFMRAEARSRGDMVRA